MNESPWSEFEPLTWLVLFQSSTSRRWIDRLVPGRFKHVMAFGWVEKAKAWVSYDVQLGRTHILLMAEADGEKKIGEAFGRDADAALLRCAVRLSPRPRLMPSGFWCVPAIKHLLGLRSGALRPDALWRDCLAQGAEIVHESRCAKLPAVPAGIGGAEGG